MKTAGLMISKPSRVGYVVSLVSITVEFREKQMEVRGVRAVCRFQNDTSSSFSARFYLDDDDLLKF